MKTVRQKVIELRTDNPHYTLREIAELCNVSTSTVRTILVEEHLPTRFVSGVYHGEGIADNNKYSRRRSSKLYGRLINKN